ncbi:MAG: amino acid adenylation domain-containing protein [Bacteriovoracaceae bacterium]|nr:amino acid adenylation domain-containing protein [Bacteriovoracaceae bacterium]
MNTTGKQIEVAFNPFRDGELFASVPTTESQKEIWSSIEIDPDANLCYNESIRIVLKGELEVGTLEKAINETIARRDALRASFSNRGKDFMVGVHHPRPLPITDYTNYSQAEQKALINKKIAQSTQYRFDLHSGPVFVFELLKLKENEHILFLTGHHLICDGWSMALIVSDISRLYERIKSGLDAHLDDEVPRFFEHALNYQKQPVHKYWLDEFKEIPRPIDLPLDFERPGFRTYESRRIDFELKSSTVESAKTNASKQRKSFYQYLLSNFAVLVRDLSQQSDIVLGISSAGQSFYNEENLVGHLVHLLPIRLDVGSDKTFSELLEHTKNKMLDAFDHQDVTYAQILQSLKLARDPSRIPLVNIIFNVDQQYEGQGMEFKELDAHYESNPRHFENFEIFINATTLGNKCVLECQYNNALFKEETIRGWLAQFETLLDRFNEDCDRSLGDVSLEERVVPESKQTSTPAKKIDVSAQWVTSARQLWEEALEVEGIPESADFFTIGGHSLLGVDVCHEAFEKFGIKVTLKDLIQNPVLIEFAKLLEQNSGETSENHKIQKLNLDTHSLASSQKQTWFWEQTNPGTNVYHLPSAIKISTDTDHKQLEKAFLSIFEKHLSLRTKFLKNGVQKVVSMEEVRNGFNLETITTSFSELPSILKEMAKEPFDLSVAPLVKATLFDCASDGKVLFTMFHHIIFDGWSFDIFFRDLDLAYRGMELESEELDYLDFCAWQKDYLNEGRFESDLGILKDKLSAPLPVLNLPTDYPRPEKINPVAGEVCFEISKPLREKLANYCETRGVSLFSVFMGCFNQALMDYSRMDEVVVGIPVRGRNSSKLLNTIGYFVNASAIRTSRTQTPRESFELAKSEVALAISHQDVPFSEVVRALKLKDNPGRTAVYQAFFSFQDVSNRKAIFNGSEYSQINVSSPHSSTDLNMWVKSSKSKLEGGIYFREDLFKKESIEQFYNYLVDLLEFSVDSDEKNWKEFNSPSVMEKVSKINNTDVFDQESCHFVNLIDEVSLKYPNKIAVVGGERELSYQELKSMSDALAAELLEDGVQTGDLIGLTCDRSAMMMVALLGILKAGCTYVPLDPSFPRDRLEYMIKDSGARRLLVSDSYTELFSLDNVQVKLLSSIDYSKKLEFRPKVDPELAAYVIYTSGSTGKPKGVEVARSSVNNFLLSMRKSPGMKDSDTLLAVTTLSFDIAVLELYLPLISGGQLIVASKEATMDGKELVKLIKEHNVTIMQATPSTWRLMIAKNWAGESHFKALCGGEAFPKDLARKLCALVGEVWNMYGPTETTVWSTCKKVSLSDEVVSIGKPIDNTQVYILDDDKKLLPLGVEGHLYIAGKGLATGYFKRPELTCEKFVPDTVKGEGLMYQTGDVARILPNGELECLGRSDNQVKLRGFRIELGEIESVIAEQENVNESVVLIRPDHTGESRLVAYITVQDEGLHNQFDLQEQISQKLPNYMVPAVFIVMDKMPKTLNEKIDRKALPMPVSKKASRQTQTPAPKRVPAKKKQDSSSVETFKRIWMDTIGVTSCSEEDHFFDVGGHSLLAVDLFRELETQLNIDLPLSTLITNPTLGELIKVALPDSEVLEGPIDERPTGQQLFVPEICSSIVPIKPTGDETPIFIFHSVGGNVLNYMKVGPLCGDHPLFGVQAFGVDGKSSIVKGIPEMAQRYLDEIRLVQPKGPYILAGGSMGGLVAYEVGRLLLEQGEELEPIIMFDTFGPGLKLKNIKVSKRSRWQEYKFGIQWRLKKVKVKVQSLFLNTLGLPIPHNIRHFNVEVNNYESLWNYKVKEFYGDIALMRVPLTDDGCYKEAQMGWGEVVKGNIDTYYVNGNHNNFIESNEFPKVFKDVLANI